MPQQTAPGATTGTVTSADGTTIAWTRIGAGPALVLVEGALCYREFGPTHKIAALLADEFTVWTYDRRGRGESTDATAPGAYDPAREVEDLAALLTAAGGHAHVLGQSSGAALALRAAAAGLPIDGLALYEAPYVVDDEMAAVRSAYVPKLHALLAAGDRGAAVRAFMTMVGMPALMAHAMRFMPGWSKLRSVAPTLAYDAAVLGDDGPDRTADPLADPRFTAVAVPTLVMSGGRSPEPMHEAARRIAAAVPGAVHRVLDGQTHMVKPEVLAPAAAGFLAGIRRDGS